MSNISFKYKDGRFLESEYMGDGDYALILTENITKDCIFPSETTLAELLEYCDGVYDINNDFIADTLDISDFTVQSVDIKIKNKKMNK